ncbi:hypothetical protein ACQP2K_00150 [Microbispora siamensis]
MNEFVGVVLLTLGVAVMLASRRVAIGPVRTGHLTGLASMAGLADDRCWRVTHEQVEAWMLAAGLVPVIAGLAAFGIEPSPALIAVALAAPVYTIALLTVAAAVGRSSLRKKAGNHAHR